MMILIWILEIAMLIGGIVLSVIALAKGIERQQSNVTIWGAVGLVCGIVGIFLLTIVFGTVSLVCGAYAKSLLDKTGDNPSFEQYKREQAMKSDPQYQAYRQASGERYEAERERNKKRKSNTWSSFLIALVVAPFVLLSALFLWSAYESGDISWPDFSNTNEPAHTIEDIGESTNDDSSWFDFFDWSSPVSSDGRQTIEDLGNGTILIDE
jgi:hypothetical protein